MSTPRQLTLDLVKPPKPSLSTTSSSAATPKSSPLCAQLRPAVANGSFTYGARPAPAALIAAGARLEARQGEVPAFDARQHIYVVDDDVDSLSESQQQRLFVLLNEIRSAGTARFVGAGNAAPMHLTLRDDVRTRLAWGLVYQVHALSDDEKAQALSAHAASRGFALSAEVVDYLLTHMPRDMRTLVAVVDALDTYALSVKKPLTVPLVRHWAEDAA